VTEITVIANTAMQIIERHVVKGLEEIFSPVVLNGLSDSKAEAFSINSFGERTNGILRRPN
jgi:hypothetical protein